MGKPVVPPVYIRTACVVLIRLGRHDGAADGHKVFVSDSSAESTGAAAALGFAVDHDHSVDQGTGAAGAVEETGKSGVREDDFGTGVVEDVCQL